MAETHTNTLTDEKAHKIFNFVQEQLAQKLHIVSTQFDSLEVNSNGNSEAFLFLADEMASSKTARGTPRVSPSTPLTAYCSLGRIIFFSEDSVRFPIILKVNGHSTRLGMVLVQIVNTETITITNYSNHLVEALLRNGSTLDPNNLTEADRELASTEQALQQKLEQKRSFIFKDQHNSIQNDISTCTQHWMQSSRPDEAIIKTYTRTLKEWDQWLDTLKENAPVAEQQARAPFPPETRTTLELLCIIPLCALVGCFIGGFLGEDVVNISISEAMKIGCLLGILIGGSIFSIACWFTFKCGKDTQSTEEDRSSPRLSPSNFSQKKEQFQSEVFNNSKVLSARSTTTNTKSCTTPPSDFLKML